MSIIKNNYGINWIYKKTKGARFQLALFTFLTLIGTIITISLAYFIKLFIDIATGEIEESLIRVGLIAIAVIGFGGIITVIRSILSQFIYGKTERGLRTELMSVILSRRLIDISKQHTGELLTKLTVDIQAVSNCFINIIRDMVGGVASAVFATAAMFFLDCRMALIMLILTPLLMFVMSIFTPFMQRASEADKRNDEINRSVMQENLSRIMLIKTYFMQTKVIAKIKNIYAHKLKSGMKLGMWEGLVHFSAEIIATAMFMVAIGVGAYFVMNGYTTFGNMIAIVQLLNFVVNPVANFAGTITQIGQAKASSERIGALYELPSDKHAELLNSVDALELVMKNISYSYNNTGENDESVNVLTNITVSFKKGTVYGIIGQSGSGKSTLLKLLIGLYTPQQGKIELLHTSGTLNYEEILPQIAYVPPVDYLFSETVLENIVMAENELCMNEVETAASNANILGFIESLPQGFNTLIGESGGTVSSGQAQRLAIARAIYKKSPVVIFDEPTANLDVDSIEKFQSVVKLLAKDKICVIVTHDISTIDICDKIYVLEEGNLREKIND
jgi:ABC-type bacteriocin/lantibiotic exporter with double-glycine peptidase domain